MGGGEIDPEVDDLERIRDAVRALCADSRRILAHARSRARLSGRVRRCADPRRLPGGPDPGKLRRQRPTHDGGRRDHGGDPRRRLQRACAAPRCTPWERCFVTAAPHRRRAGCRRSHRASCACRPSGSPSRPRAPTPQSAHRRGAKRRPLRRQWPEDLDLARRAFRSAAAHRAHHAARGRQASHRRAFRIPGRHALGAGRRHQHQTDPHDDEPRHHRAVLRRSAGADGEPDRRGKARVSAISSPA